MALFGLACPLCILIIVGLLAYVHYYNVKIKEKFSSAQLYFPDHCKNLNFSDCLKTSHCGWLVDHDYSRCVQGTPMGPLNSKLQPDAENSVRGNTQYDRWIYSHQNPFIFC
jgi:hypothetical protein